MKSGDILADNCHARSSFVVSALITWSETAVWEKQENKHSKYKLHDFVCLNLGAHVTELSSKYNLVLHRIQVNSPFLLYSVKCKPQ